MEPPSRPIIALSICWAVGIVAGVQMPGYASWVCASAAVAAAVILISIFRDRGARLMPLILFCTLGYLSIQWWVAPSRPPDHITRFANRGQFEITGTIVSEPIQRSRRMMFVVQARTITPNQQVLKTRGRIRVTVAGAAPSLMRGDRIRFRGKIRRIRNFFNPGGFDYQRYMIFQRVEVTTFTPGKRLVVLATQTRSAATPFFSRYRRQLGQLIDSVATGPRSAVLRALIIGDRDSISPELRTVFSRTGAGHLLAISGLHMGIVAALVFFAFQRLFAWVPILLKHAMARKAAALLTLGPIWAYAIVAGLSPSTQRAAILATVFLLGVWLQREHDAVNTLAAAALVILLVHPPALYSISFQLSFAAVAAIILGIKCIWPRFEGMESAVFKRVAAFVLVSACAILGTLPLVMFYFNQVSLIGLPANLVAVPVIGFLVVPLGLLAAFFYPVVPVVAAMLIKGAAWVLTPALTLLTSAAALPWAAIDAVTPTPFEMGCYAMLLWALGVRVSGSGPLVAPVGTENWRWERFGRTLSPWRRLSSWALGLALVLLVMDAGYWAYVRFGSNQLRVTMIDVGQGSSALLELPHGPVMLIDGGGFNDNTIFDVGKRILAPVLYRRKIATVDVLVLSHPNADHLNGLLHIARTFDVKEIWTNNEPADVNTYRELQAMITQGGIYQPVFRQMARHHTVGGVELDILHPPPDFLQRRSHEHWRRVNNNSLVLKVTYGGISFLFSGDVHARAEYELLTTAGTKLASTVLLAPHHGSKTSSSPGFIAAVDPEVVVVSCGWKNRFGFPDPAVISRYRSRGCRVYTTAQYGAVRFVTNGKDYRVMTTI